jgi:group II intron reverse transcriptase/maturase
VNQTKSYDLPKHLIYEAYKQIKANQGSAGVDAQSLKDFERNLKNHRYQLWNRMSSGSYFPQAVKRVEIPKVDGGMRPLGIPTVADRIAQLAVKMQIEAELERHFHPHSYGYRPHQSAHQAVEKVRQRCWQRPWVLDMDIKGFFDSIDHDLLLRAVDKHVVENWQRLYIRRWLQAPIQHLDGTLEYQRQGTPQGGVISPLLANLLLHYVFDKWVEKHCKGIQLVRYADDIICHCKTSQEAKHLRSVLTLRFAECGLTLHSHKTRIVSCKSWKHTANYECISFDFLGFTFRPRLTKLRNGVFLVCFLPAISPTAAKRIRTEINSWSWRAWIQDEVWDIIRFSQSKLRGWMEYYGKFGRSAVSHVLFHFDQKLSDWAKRKYHSIKTKAQAVRRVMACQRRNPKLLAHWSGRFIKVE